MENNEKSDLIVGFLKVRNEIIRENNIVRCLHNMQEFCDEIYAVDDASYDGTYEYLLSQLPADHVIRIAPEEQDFAKELAVKQRLLELIHQSGPWKFIWWSDADEVLDREGTENIRDFCRANLQTITKAWAFHYQQLWKSSRWARIDSEFDDGWFVKLWRYSPDLSFEVIPGTHNRQFPVQFDLAFQRGLVDRSKWEVLHYGNYGTNLRFKCIQYYGGLGGVDRHLIFPNASYREIPVEKFPSGAEYDQEVGDMPKPFSEEHVELIRKIKNMKNLEKTFCVTISTYNRGNTLGRAIDSILKQTYQDFIVVVVDDGSTDNTKEIMRHYQDKDPRVFYVQSLDHRGGVAVNEIACDIAVNTATWWVRLGSDDWLAPNKLELDFLTFEEGHKAVYGPFQAHDQATGQFQEIGNLPFPPDKQRACFEQQGFLASWADFAVATEVLAMVKKKYGMYVHPQLVNMEDCLLNYRICKITPWIWRGIYDGNVIIAPDETMMYQITHEPQKLTPSGFWNKDPQGSSANHMIYAQDRTLTTALINGGKEHRMNTLAWVCACPGEADYDVFISCMQDEIDCTIYGVDDPHGFVNVPNVNFKRISKADIASLQADMIVLRYPQTDWTVPTGKVVCWCSEQGPTRPYAMETSQRFQIIAVNNRVDYNYYRNHFRQQDILYLPYGGIKIDVDFDPVYDAIASCNPHYSCGCEYKLKKISMDTMVLPLLSYNIAAYGMRDSEHGWSFIGDKYKGHFNHWEYHKYLAKAKLYVDGTFNWSIGGFGCKLARALATGIPVIWHQTLGMELEGFEKGNQLDWSASPEETVKLVDYYLTHDQERIDMGRRGKNGFKTIGYGQRI